MAVQHGPPGLGPPGLDDVNLHEVFAQHMYSVRAAILDDVSGQLDSLDWAMSKDDDITANIAAYVSVSERGHSLHEPVSGHGGPVYRVCSNCDLSWCFIA